MTFYRKSFHDHFYGVFFEKESKYWPMTNFRDDLMTHSIDKPKLVFLFTNLCKNSLSSKN